MDAEASQTTSPQHGKRRALQRQWESPERPVGLGTALPSLDEVTLPLNSVTLPKKRGRRKGPAYAQWNAKIVLPSGFVFKMSKKMPWAPKKTDGDWDPEAKRWKGARHRGERFARGQIRRAKD